MEINSTKPFWWVKSNSVKDVNDNGLTLDLTSNRPSLPSTKALKESELDEFGENESDIGSIIEEINKLAARSPLGPYEKDTRERSVEDIMKEAEQIFMESSKSFEQLSARSKTSANLSNSFNDPSNSTPSLKSASPLPLDTVTDKNSDCYSDDFTGGEMSPEALHQELFDLKLPDVTLSYQFVDNAEAVTVTNDNQEAELEREDSHKSFPITSPELTFNSKPSNTLSPHTEIERTYEDLKDARERNNVLHLQLNNLNQTYKLLRVAHDELLESNCKLNNRILEYEVALEKYKLDAESNREQLNKLSENESNVNKLVEFERIQLKNSKQQNDKDARCILDLNRQVKEMERIIARKHPDSVSALIVAAKNDEVDNNVTAKRFLEERIKNLENEAVLRDQQSSKIFLEVQEKFSEMKNKYESHIEDLELHVTDLKNQLKQKVGTFEVYTQTYDNEEPPAKETKNASSQTTQRPNTQPPKKVEKPEHKEDAHLLATIRGLQADIANKEKTIIKLQKELDETKKTIKRLQKEREGSLKNLSGKNTEFRSYPEKLANAAQCNCKPIDDLEEELRLLKADRDKIQIQLRRIEDDYQQLKTKRLFDLSTLQQAHENEISTYINNITPLQKQLEIQQSTIGLLEEQLDLAKLKSSESSNPIPNQNETGSYLCDSSKSINNPERRTIVCAQCTLRQQQLIMYKTELDQLLETVQALT